MTEPKIMLNYDERQALATVRKLLQRKPEAIELLMKDMSKAAAVNVLLTAKKEMHDLHLMAQAMVSAAGIIAKMDKPEELTGVNK
jgi:hypothetical protein